MPSNELREVLSDVNGDPYFLTAAGSVYFRDGKFVPVPEANVPNGGRFYLGPTGNLWLYDKAGIKQISPDKSETFYPITFDVNGDFRALKLFEDKRGDLWVGDRTGVYCLKNGEIAKFTESSDVPPGALLRPMVEDGDGNIWFANWRAKGLLRFRDDKFEFYDKSDGLSGDIIDKAFKDREGTIWLVALDRGVNRLEKQLFKSLSTGEGLIHTEVYPMLQTRGGEIYVGTTRGLSRLTGDSRFVDVLAENFEGVRISVTSLWEDEENHLWIGASNGDLFRLENNEIKRFKLGNNETVAAILKDRGGNVWLGTDKGLLKFRDDKVIARLTAADGLPSADIKVIHEDRSGAVWFGTYGGLIKLENDKFTSFTAENGLASNRVRTIYEDADGTFWIGTYDGGLSRFRDGRFFNYTLESGLFSNGIFQIFEDEKGNFWISCNKGIFRVNKKDLEDFADGKTRKINSVAYGKQDGMLNTECNGGMQPAGIKDSDGKFWFPTQDGVVVVNPKEISFNSPPPPVQIENVLVERESVNFKDGITLWAGDENLEIHYTGISFIKPEQVKFRYRIEGLEEDWTDVNTRRDVYFPFLPAGEYTFRVIAANADGVWNETGAQLRIRVNAPFWQTNWFFAIFSLAVIAVIFTVFRLRERELNRRRIVRQEFSRKLLESQEQERKRISSELHDSLGQYLLAVKNWAMFGLNSVGKENNAREYLTEVMETTSLALEEVREMTHNLRPYQLERLGLTNTLEYMLKNVKNAAAINFAVEIENIDGVLSKESEIVFYRIVQETVNNVLKHSEAAGAKIKIKPDESGGIGFFCRDDGKGFDVQAVKNSPQSGLGLEGIAERAEILGGEFEIDSAVGKGTTVSLKIPGGQ